MSSSFNSGSARRNVDRLLIVSRQVPSCPFPAAPRVAWRSSLLSGLLFDLRQRHKNDGRSTKSAGGCTSRISKFSISGRSTANGRRPSFTVRSCGWAVAALTTNVQRDLLAGLRLRERGLETLGREPLGRLAVLHADDHVARRDRLRRRLSRWRAGADDLQLPRRPARPSIQARPNSRSDRVDRRNRGLAISAR